MGKLINRIPGSHLLISSLLGSTLRMRVESLGKPRDVNKRSQSLAYMAANASVKTSRLCFFFSWNDNSAAGFHGNRGLRI